MALYVLPAAHKRICAASEQCTGSNGEQSASCLHSQWKQRENPKNQLSKITRYNNDHSLPTVGIETMGSLSNLFHAEMLDSYIRMTFEDGEYMCFADWDAHLISEYGDYMQLPPESERTWTHHPVIIDFEHNYEELPVK